MRKEVQARTLHFAVFGSSDAIESPLPAPLSHGSKFTSQNLTSNLDRLDWQKHDCGSSNSITVAIRSLAKRIIVTGSTTLVSPSSSN